MRCISIDQDISSATFKHFEQTNRMLDRYGKDSFIILDFSRKVEPTVVRDILNGGLTINDDTYHFIGCSSGGLKERTCYMFKGSRREVDRILEECGSFSSLRSRHKRLKRIGLLFSSATPTRIRIPDNKVVLVKDIETDGGNFTDGCGSISEELANKLTTFCEVTSNYRPSVFQIRYQGCKGVVAVDPSLEKEDKLLVVRPSMKKFEPGTKPFDELWLCDYSRPYTFGHLNRQFITLLSSLGVKDEVFFCIQNVHFERLRNVLHKPEAAFDLLLLDNKPELASRCTTDESLSTLQPQLSKLRSNSISKLEKLHLPVLKSRNVFGVCDPTGVLQYGQCYFRYTERGSCKTLCGKVVVAKNPCYLLGDVRVLTAVNIDQLDHLVDCIVFPTQGTRPHPSEIAGSDLDGDRYFVCWDEGLIVPRIEKPYNYPSEDAPEIGGEITRKSLIDYFASQKNNMGKIDSYYKYWANKNGAGCSECQQLGRLFSRSVDATKTGDVVQIPSGLKPPLRNECIAESHGEASSSTVGGRVHVWQEMEKRAIKEREALSKDIIHSPNLEAISEEFLCSLLEHKLPNLSDFQLFELVHRWCMHQHFSDDESHQRILELTKHINFGEFSIDQQVAAIDTGIPLKTVTNALNLSTLLPRSLLQKFLLDDPHHNWRFYFHCSSADFKWKHLLRGLQRHPESMIVIKLPDDVTFVIHFLSPPKMGESRVDGGAVVAYFTSGRFNLNLQSVSGSNLKLDLDNEKLQLFRGVKTATFIWLCSEQLPSKGNKDTLFDRISVDLTSFKKNILLTSRHPPVRKHSFLAIEMYVKTSHFQPAYLDMSEADVDDDYVLEGSDFSEDIEDLPSDSEEIQDKQTETHCSYSGDATAVDELERSVGKGCCRSFKRTLDGVLVSKDDEDVSRFIPALLELLMTMAANYCHKALTDEMVQTILDVIASLSSGINSPGDLLKLLSCTAQLRLPSLKCITDSIMPYVQASHPTEYLDVIGKWKLWYFLPPKTAAQLSHHFFTLYTSLCSRAHAGLGPSSMRHQTERIEVESNSCTSLSCSNQVPSRLGSNVSLQQHQIDAYIYHFSRLVINHLLCEVSTSHDIAKVDVSCDTNTSLVMLHCYDHKRPHPSPGAPDGCEDGESNSTASWMACFEKTKNIASKNFTVGSYVSINLMKKQDSPPRVLCLPVAIGRIVDVSRNPTNLVTEISEPVPVCLRRSAKLRQGHWQLVLIGNITLFERQLKALRSIRDNPSCTALLPLLVDSHSELLPETQCTVKSDSPRSSHLQTITDPALTFTIQPMSPLNCSQKEAVCASLTQKLTLIHGPPGTGKTHVACEIVQQQLARDKSHPILVVAETNLAVDNLCEKLMNASVLVVRIGKLEHTSPHVRHISLEGQLEKKRIQEGRDRSKSPFPDKRSSKSILSAAQVIAATCTGAGDPILRGMKFPFIVLDEATQVNEPTSLIPLVLGCQQLTLIGDPEQLAPAVPGARDSEFSVDEMAVSLFHRLQRSLPTVFLSEQHRMHPKLAEFPSKKFYEGRLSTAQSRFEQNTVFQVDIPILESDKPVTFVTVSERESRYGTSYCNQAEAEAVVKVIHYLFDHQVSAQQIVVLTPYTGQVKCITKVCQREKISHVRVHTIDSYQGREADVIIFSTVRSNTRGEVGFVDDRFRMNVLLTRARHGLIGVGCKETLSAGSPLWKEWFENVKILPSVERLHDKSKRVGSNKKRYTSEQANDTLKDTRSCGTGGGHSRSRGSYGSRSYGHEGSTEDRRSHGATEQGQSWREHDGDRESGRSRTQRRDEAMRGRRRGGGGRGGSSPYCREQRQGEFQTSASSNSSGCHNRRSQNGRRQGGSRGRH